MKSKRKQIPESVRIAVLTEAGFRCAVPNCRAILAIDLHHIVPVSDSGSGDPSNLLALCPTCHALHHRGTIPFESILKWKMALVANYHNLSSKSHISTDVKHDCLRVLYFHDQVRSSGLDHCRSTQLIQELERRGHHLRFCWAVHPPLKNDTANCSRDIILPEAVREWKPQAIVFERGLFVGEPRLPIDLLDELEATGAVVILAIPPYEYMNHRAQYDNFLGSRGITVPTAPREEPKCQGDKIGGDIIFSFDQLAHMSVAGTAILNGVHTVRLYSARPIVSESVLSILMLGQENVFVKAYHNDDIHGFTYPILGLLNDKEYRTEAIFLSDIAVDLRTPADNAIYLANLMEWLSRQRSQSLRWAADSSSV
jgi:hypothetical protein